MQASNAAGKPVMLDFYADWCTYCLKMEDYTFSDAGVQAALAGTTLLQADVTANDSVDLALLNHFKLFAPPAILFFDTSGQERRESRMVGFMNAEDFSSTSIKPSRRAEFIRPTWLYAAPMAE